MKPGNARPTSKPTDQWYVIHLAQMSNQTSNNRLKARSKEAIQGAIAGLTMETFSLDVVE
jgi:hypothetical protein